MTASSHNQPADSRLSPETQPPRQNPERRTSTRDLLGDHDGTLARHFTKAATDFAPGATRTFALVYLFLHGLIKIGLVLALLRKIMPAYPIAVVVLGGFGQGTNW